MELTVQIFSGGFLEKAAPYDISYAIIEEKLNKVLPQLPVTKLIMGWAQDKELYEKTAAYLAKRNIDFYLWFPVFSETGTVKNLNALVDFEDRHIKNCEKHGEEDFSFCCPSGGQNIEKILDIFEEQFVSLPFKGIFLDRIRYPSFASGQRFGHGFKSVFSCFCPRCIKIYKKENLDVELLKTILLQPRYGSDGNPAPLGITGYRGNGEYAFNEPIISDFFKIKAKIIFQSVERICRYFRNKNYRIGLDVFAPFLSPFVGQNLKALSGLCDFIKPMMYRATNAPAGMPFETEALLQETGNASAVNRKRFYNLLGIDTATAPFDLAFSVNDLHSLTTQSGCPVYAGLEFVRKEKIAEVFPDYIEETIKAFAKTGIRGFSMSWNLLEAPEDNIAKTGEMVKTLICR